MIRILRWLLLIILVPIQLVLIVLVVLFMLLEVVVEQNPVGTTPRELFMRALRKILLYDKWLLLGDKDGL